MDKVCDHFNLNRIKNYDLSNFYVKSFGLIGKDFLGVLVSKVFSMLIIPIETAFISSVYLFLKNKKNQDEVINS